MKSGITITNQSTRPIEGSYARAAWTLCSTARVATHLAGVMNLVSGGGINGWSHSGEGVV